MDYHWTCRRTDWHAKAVTVAIFLILFMTICLPLKASFSMQTTSCSFRNRRCLCSRSWNICSLSLSMMVARARARANQIRRWNLFKLMSNALVALNCSSWQWLKLLWIIQVIVMICFGSAEEVDDERLIGLTALAGKQHTEIIKNIYFLLHFLSGCMC